MSLSVRRFSKWSPSHRERVLKRAGVTPQQFASSKPKEQRQVLRRARLKRALPQAPPIPTPEALVQRAGDLRFGEARRGLEGQVRGSVGRQGDITNWFGQYRQSLQRSQEESKAAYDARRAEIERLGTSMQGVDSAERARLAAEEQKSADIRGTGPSPENLARTDASSASRGSLRDINTARLAEQDASWQSHLADRGRIGSGAEVAAHQTEANRRRLLEEDVTALSKERGGWEETQLAELAENERKEHLENLAFLGRQEAERLRTKRTRGMQRYGQRLKARNIGLNEEATKNIIKEKERARDSYRPPGGGGGKGPSFTDAQTTRANAILKKGIGNHSPEYVAEHRRDFILKLAADHGVNATLARRVVHRYLRKNLGSLRVPEHGPSRARVRAERKTR